MTQGLNLGTATVIRANARRLPLADNTVDLVVTSPPYFALRSYQDGGEHYAGQIGDEPTPVEFVDSLIEVTRECVRVLKPSGSLWVNLGDKYVADNRGSGVDKKRGEAKHAPRGPLGYITGGMRQKSLMGIPWRYALRCIDNLGLILRAEVIWSKPNGLPESVTDRVRRSHEQWFHFTLEPRYYSAVDEICEPYTYGPAHPQDRSHPSFAQRRTQDPVTDMWSGNPLGKLPSSVWTIPTEPLRVPDHLGIDHFAAFPTEWPKRIIQGWSPAGVCAECGEGRRPITDRRSHGPTGVGGRVTSVPSAPDRREGARKAIRVEITGEACACDEPTAPTTPGIVLDPFGGTGTTAMVAKALGRRGISVDMSADYCRLADWRTNDRNQLAKVLDLDKVAQQDPDQLDLFGEAHA